MNQTRSDTFTFRITPDERRDIELIANRLEQKKADAVRLILRTVASSFAIDPTGERLRRVVSGNENE